MLPEVLSTAYVYDLPEEAGTAEGVLTESEALLDRVGLRPPHLTDWETACEYVVDYCEGRRVIEDSDLSSRLAQDAEDLAHRVPLAAVVPAMVVVAEWEGTAGPWLLRDTEGAQNWGWHGLVLPLARILARGSVLWAGRDLVNRALGTVRRAEGRRMPAYTSEALAGLVAVRDELQGQYLRQRDELAWRLWKSCQPPDAAVRAPLAALLWTLGDPWWAHAVGREGSVPSRGQLEGLLDVALRCAPLDPMLTSVGARLWGAPGIETTGHEAMYRRLSRRWVASDAGRELEKPLATLRVSPSAAYSRALVSWFRGTLTDEERETICSLQPFVASAYPAAAVRFLALHLLLNEENDPDVQEKWWRLAEHVRLVAADEHWHTQSDLYDRSMDLPFYYLEGASDDCLTAIEGQRRASLEFDLWNIRPPRPSEPKAQSLLNEEDNLLEEVRVLRYVSQLGRLPLWVSQAYRTHLTAEDIRQEPAARWDDPDRARISLDEDRRRLNELAGELAESAPNYAYIRRDPPGTLQDFAAMLTARDGE